MRLQFIFCSLSTVDNLRATLIITVNYFIYLFMHLFRTTLKSSRADCLTALWLCSHGTGRKIFDRLKSRPF